MDVRTVSDALRFDRWTVAAIERDAGPGTLRFRAPVLKPGDVEDYPKVLRMLWAYAAEGSARLPTSDEAAAMDRFETAVCTVLENDARAFLAAVLTFDGARQWVFYTGDVPECEDGCRKRSEAQSRCPSSWMRSMIPDGPTCGTTSWAL